MATNWPTSVWNPQDPLADDRGMVPFSMDPGTAALQSYGVTYDVYLNYNDTIYSTNQSNIHAWDVMENPLYQAMAEYGGYDWDTLVNQFNEDVGPREAQPHRIQTQEAGTIDTVPATYEEFNNYAEAVAWAEENDYDVSDIELGAQSLGEDDEERYWGITNQTWIDRFNDWTGSAEDLLNMFKRQDVPLIRRGPSAADYGIVRADNNIFAHYGLDRPPADPKELATNYSWNLSKTWTSNVNYSVPPDLKRVNLSGDSGGTSSNPILAST